MQRTSIVVMLETQDGRRVARPEATTALVVVMRAVMMVEKKDRQKVTQIKVTTPLVV